MRYFATIISAAMLLAASGAQAAWLNTFNADPFTDEKTYVTATLGGGYMLGFGCVKGQPPMVFYVTPESYSGLLESVGGDISMISAMSGLVFKIDGDSAKNYSAGLDEKMGRVRFHGNEGVFELMQDVAGARRRIAVAATLTGKRLHAAAFSAAGSTKAVKALFSACNLSKATVGAEALHRAAVEKKRAARPRLSLDGLPAAVESVVLAADMKPFKRSLLIRLKERVTEGALRRIAEKLVTSGYERTFMGYLLPGMKEGEGAWASTHFDPKLRVRVFGTKKGEKERAIAKELAISPVPGAIGSWYIDHGVISRICRLYVAKKKTYAKYVWVKDGNVSTEMVNVKQRKDGVEYRAPDNEHGEYLLLRPDGVLESRDADGPLEFGEKIR